ncbi:ATP-dependent DNA ligase [Candidatus Micrarchaeota archaeon]|nr:ATP-dependent DNA ligase [Candidatus Micrarchaeota archaeon]
MEFVKLADVFEKMEQTASRLQMTADLAELFKETQPKDIAHITYLCQGIIAPEFTGIELGMGDKLTEQAIAHVSGKSVKEIEKEYKKQGDLGITAERMLEKKAQQFLSNQSLTTEKVRQNVYRIATTAGSGSQDLKVKLLAELLANAKPREAKVLVRFVQGRLRLGIGTPTILDALSVYAAHDKSLRSILERAYNMRSDLGLVAQLLFQKKMKEIESMTPQVFSPIRPALAERLTDAEQIIEKIGSCRVEGKYDGFRLQVHVKGKDVKLFSRKQEPMTPMFPDIVQAVQHELHVKEAIIEGEAIAYDEERQRFLPFQVTIQRRRKHGISEKSRQIPLKLFAFELLYADGIDYTIEPYEKRHLELTRRIHSNAKTVRVAESKTVHNARELNSFFEKSVGDGLEGVMAKDPKAPYIAGARKFAWIKLKKSYGKLTDTFDLVVVGYYKGKGKRTPFEFGGLLAAAYDDQNKRFRTLARIGTGFSEEQMKQLHHELEKKKTKSRPNTVDSNIEPDVWVQPSMVVEINADEISQSPMHTCGKSGSGEGLALRFPRLVQIRKDKEPEDATTESEVLEMFEMQQQR